MIWSYPDLTLDRLLLNLLFSVWVIVGTLFEEGDLLASTAMRIAATSAKCRC